MSTTSGVAPLKPWVGWKKGRGREIKDKKKKGRFRVGYNN